MEEVSSQYLVDIMVLDSVIDKESGFMPLWIVLVALLLLVVIFLRYRKQPVRSLRLQLQGGQLSARQVAHQLAQSVDLNSQQAGDLDKLRFSKTEPTAQQLVQFMRQIRS